MLETRCYLILTHWGDEPTSMSWAAIHFGFWFCDVSWTIDGTGHIKLSVLFCSVNMLIWSYMIYSWIHISLFCQTLIFSLIIMTDVLVWLEKELVAQTRCWQNSLNRFGDGGAVWWREPAQLGGISCVPHSIHWFIIIDPNIQSILVIPHFQTHPNIISSWLVVTQWYAMKCVECQGD